MNVSFLEIIDQLRFIIGTIVCEWIFVINAVPKRTHFWTRAVLGLIICIVISLSYFPIVELFLPWPVVQALVIGVWWFLASFVSIGFIMSCFQISVCNALYRCILGLMLQQLVTVLLRYGLVGMMFPDFPDNNPILYILVMLAFYSVFCVAAYKLAAKKMIRKNVMVDSRKMFWSYILLISIFSIYTDVTSGLFTWLTKPEDIDGSYELLEGTLLPLYCIGVMLVLCAVTFVILYIVHQTAYLQQENEILERLQSERQKQYVHARENIDIINQKCHDLRHQIQALRLADETERARLIEETDRAVLFYDAIVKTNNEVLDTILTEKSLVCTSHKIKLSCNINVTGLDYIAVIDLYTILGNALDNAVECVSRYEDADKRIISLSIRENGQMLNIFVENFFDGELYMKNGYPVTSKEDRAYHGYGIKSVHLLAEKYGGDIRISHQNNTFSLHVMIPIQ